MKQLKLWDLPKKLQEAMDGAEFVTGFYLTTHAGKMAYQVTFGDSFEVWSRTYDAQGKLLTESAYCEKEASQ